MMKICKPPKLQRLASEENPSVSSMVSGVSAPAASSSIATTAGDEVMGGDVSGVEEVGVIATAKGQDAVGKGIFPNTSIMPSTPHSASSTSHFDPSTLLIAKRSDSTPATTPAHQAARAPSSEPPSSSSVQNALKASSQSSILATPEHTNAALSDDERKTTVRTNSIDSEKGSQSSSVSPDRKQSPGSEGQTPTHKEASLQQPSSSSSVQASSSRPFVAPIGPIESSGGVVSVLGASGTGGISRTGSEDGSTATPTSVPPTGVMLQPHELAVVQSEHSAESTPTHISQGSLESTSSSLISSQEQFSQELKVTKKGRCWGIKRLPQCLRRAQTEH